MAGRLTLLAIAGVLLALAIFFILLENNASLREQLHKASATLESERAQAEKRAAALNSVLKERDNIHAQHNQNQKDLQEILRDSGDIAHMPLPDVLRRSLRWDAPPASAPTPQAPDGAH